MPGKTSRAALALTAAEEERLGDLARSRTAPVREAERAKILLAYVENRSITEVMRRVGVGRSTVYKCIDKALADSVAAGLKDAYHRPHAPEMTEEAKAWVVSLACTKPKDHGRAAEVWSISAWAQNLSRAMPKRPDTRVWCKRARVPFGGFSTSGRSSCTRSAITWNGATRSVCPHPQHGSWLNLIECGFATNSKHASARVSTR